MVMLEVSSLGYNEDHRILQILKLKLSQPDSGDTQEATVAC